MKLTVRQKAAFGIGAVGKDMVYALSASYVMYYYQDILKISPSFVGLILMLARVFDALNDPFMGILVAKTKTRWGRFRPWLVSGTVLNALVLYALYSAPDLGEAGMMIYFTVVYILWGVTYTMMDIPYWSMIPAVTDTPSDTENLSVIGRTCAGAGSALIMMGTMILVGILGGSSERLGFHYVAMIVAGIFIVTEIICAASVREKKNSSMETVSVKEMFKALFANDQALVVVLAIVCINTALYLTSSLIIYFFKYDFGGEGWKGTYTLFSTVGGAFQILGMMIVY
ncbi:MAG: MFS transporter, partial [Blautia sp.]|nr:MFS transporter [Blautia sp.]